MNILLKGQHFYAGFRVTSLRRPVHFILMGLRLSPTLSAPRLLEDLSILSRDLVESAVPLVRSVMIDNGRLDGIRTIDRSYHQSTVSTTIYYLIYC
jgi:hypothetical protein